MQTKKYSGSCLCGTITFAINGALESPLNCHCPLCQKAHAAPFRSRAAVAAQSFYWTAGEEHITWYESSPGCKRGFCKRCGTRLISTFEDTPQSYGVPLAILDGAIDVRPLFHVYTKHKASWFEITDSLPQYEQLP
jgi:hypothetical protein